MDSPRVVGLLRFGLGDFAKSRIRPAFREILTYLLIIFHSVNFESVPLLDKTTVAAGFPPQIFHP